MPRKKNLLDSTLSLLRKDKRRLPEIAKATKTNYFWLRSIDGKEEDGPKGWGFTEDGAVADLQDRFDEGTPASDLLMREFDDERIRIEEKNKQK